MDAIKCPLCGGVHSKLAFRVGDVRVQRGGKTFDYYRCADCTATFIHPFPDYVALEDFYGEEYFDSHNITSASGLIESLRYIKKFFKLGGVFESIFQKERKKIFSVPGGNFLDVGCATGMQNIRLMREFPSWHFYGVEPDEFAFQQAKQLPNFHVTKGFLQDAHFPDDFFDVVLLSQVLEHIENPISVITECRRILKRGGKLIITVPNAYSLSSKIFGKYWYNVDAPRHLYQLNPQSLRFIMKRAGFTDIKIKKEHLRGSFIKSSLIIFGTHPDKFDNNFLYLITNNIFRRINFGGGIYMIMIK